jgi:nicotinate-nucleotide pyrophosphorylase (carboxylating)
MVSRAGGARVVCGAWKKVDPSIRAGLRRAVLTGGAGIRISDRPFVYLDKNYVRMFGGVRTAVERAKAHDGGRLVAVQLRGEQAAIASEATAALVGGADILVVDTGRLEDLDAVAREGRGAGWREKVQLAFGGGVTLATVAEAATAGADIVDVGRAIVDAPLLDFSLDVEE